ncbi:MAG: rhodanese-like domain-containing protein [Desulfobacterales bacterium]|nr:rhodanese-like domain-containing protein [Desulfobacterales bacterium]
MSTNRCAWLFIMLSLFLLLTTPAGAAGTKETPKSLPGINIIDSATLKNWLDQGEDFYLLDARKASDYESGYIPGAENCIVPSDISIEAAAIDKTVAVLKKYESLRDIEKSDKIVAYCNSVTCWRSPKASLALVKMGFSNVFWLREGIYTWKKNGFPVE